MIIRCLRFVNYTITIHSTHSHKIYEETIEKIEQLASEKAIKISNMIPSSKKGKSKAAQKELMELRLTESKKLQEYLMKVYETFQEH